MKINFYKNDLVSINVVEPDIPIFVQTFGCKINSFPTKYLGAPLHFISKLRKEDHLMVDKFRAVGWRGWFFSTLVGVMLIRACLSSIPVYLLFWIKFSKLAIKAFNSRWSIASRDDYEGHRKISLG
jgi:hypothetical protein